MKVLIVCTGNTCRSPMAAGLLRKIAPEHGITVEVRTAGMAYHPDKRVAKNAVLAMEELGVDISDEYSKPVTPENLAWADIVLTLQENHAAHLAEDHPTLEPKVRFIGRDIQDPYCGPLAEYRRVRDELSGLLLRLVPSLTRT